MYTFEGGYYLSGILLLSCRLLLPLDSAVTCTVRTCIHVHDCVCFYGSIRSDSLCDGHGYTPHSIYSWLTAVLYNRRSKIDPLWITAIVGGYHDKKP